MISVRRIWLAQAFAVVLAIIGSRTLVAHEGDDHDHGEPTVQELPAAARWPKALVLPAIEGPRPWSDKPLFNDSDRFQIAIMTDRTGGHRPGIWEKGVEKVNLLRPEFVVSVGDLIEGYSEDPKELEAQWKEFLGFIDRMKMRFFFVAGNHDLSNPLMHKVWREHFGREWYSFDYKGVHFVALSSEDPETRIGQEQLKWLEGDLTKHEDARWTLVFLHKPLWIFAERELAAGNADSTNWKHAEKLLGSRQHTVFAGHVHHYVQFDRNGTKYYQLATTGGGSQLRGLPYGEFDHVTWLTMEKDGPYVAHLLLDGVLAPDVVTEKGIARFRDFLAKAAIEVAPILVRDADGFSEGRIDVRLTNGFDSRVEIAGRIEGLPLRGLSVDPQDLHLAADAGKTAELAVNVRFGERIAFEHLAQTVFSVKLWSVGDEPRLSAERQLPVIIDAGYDVPKSPTTIVVDGQLDEWGELPLTTSDRPLVLENAAAWNGPGDASLRFAARYDDNFVYLAARVTNDRVIEGDLLELWLDARSSAARIENPNLDEPGCYQIAVQAPGERADESLSIRSTARRPVPQGAKSANRRSDKGYDVELALPLAIFKRPQGGDWDSFQAALVIHDVDEPAEKPAKVLWRGTERYQRRNLNFGRFIRVR